MTRSGWLPQIMQVSRDSVSSGAILIWANGTAIVIPGHKTLPRTMSGSIALWRPGFGVVSVAQVVIEGSADAPDLVSHLEPC